MTYNFVSSKVVLAKIYRDFRPADGSFLSDALEWIGESLQAMDISPLHEQDKVQKTITSHRAKLPCDLRAIVGIEYNGYPLPLGHDLTGLSLSEDNPRTTAFYPNSEGESNLYQSADVSESIPKDPEDISWTGNNITTVKTNIPNGGEYYNVAGGFIVTSFESGTIQLHYKKFPTDNKGLPMIPDNFLVKEAITWYIISRMLMAGYKHPQFNFQYADERWEQKSFEAQNDVMFPSIEDTKSFGKLWVRLIDGIHLPDQFFMNAEEGEGLRLFGDEYDSV